ncbi:MAG: PqqD family peptide modification chaperone [Blastocatellia bacterium]|nr:PqqD family peptide modification chaperone [Blastocatellia bacterium]
MPNTPKPVSRQANIVVQDLESEVSIYDLSINKALCLNETSALVFQLCDGTNSVAEISNLMSVKLKTLVSN